MGAHSATSAGRGRRSTTSKVVASAAVVGAAASILSGGIYAAWTSGGAHTQSVSSAKVTGAFSDVGSNAFTVAVTEMLPGDYINRYATLENTGDVDQDFALSLLGNGALTEAADGLKASVTECSTGWVDGACAGVVTDLIAEGYLTDAGQSTTVALVAGTSKSLRVHFLLPDNAASAFQDQDDAIVVTATGSAVGGGVDRSAG